MEFIAFDLLVIDLVHCAPSCFWITGIIGHFAASKTDSPFFPLPLKASFIESAPEKYIRVQLTLYRSRKLQAKISGNQKPSQEPLRRLNMFIYYYILNIAPRSY